MMDALEAALQQGSLGTAAELDKSLKETKGTGMRLTAAQADRLAQLRAELKRLSDWARWGGNVSREELIKTVEGLTTQNLPMAELAKKVGSMRERWKALDSLSGAAPKSLWERFDRACSAAYAPAAAHFRHLADERHANAARGEALVQEAEAEIARLQSGEADWKHVAGTVQRLRLAWSHLGAIDRKDKKRLDQRFGAALTTLQGPLEEQRKMEVSGRERLIEEVAALDPHDRHAVDRLRDIQARWQEHARALPLERKAEQALWQRFRAACDDLFARRKESAHAADNERRAHETAKEAISARLEAAAPDATPASAGKLLREAAAEWQAIGPVPRAHEARREALPRGRGQGAAPRRPGPSRRRHACCRRRTRQAAHLPGAGRRTGAPGRGARCRRVAPALGRPGACRCRVRHGTRRPFRGRLACHGRRPRRLRPPARSEPHDPPQRIAAPGSRGRHRQRRRIRARPLAAPGRGPAIDAESRRQGQWQRRGQGSRAGRRTGRRTGCGRAGLAQPARCRPWPTSALPCASSSS
ncbi:DUF349 domain-containing protein [Massilia sp. Dwa41.01b]|uniref:DUF349 domain-containing protein n=1 Tax=Massilia sp. Dwa41.01b TaxID=2709302 RepID=UPI0016000689|nr:DUF349 domain-containing protein [Massilia sp. Dwa41.01b]QNA89569.1 DUF349 domain-containing protein [Massilia sp. Dwa41.01b]